MKTLSIIALCTLISGTAFAAYTGPTSPAFTKGDVRTALNSSDDTKLTLEGYIINHLKKDKYTFRDNTGTIVIEIDDEDFRGIEVNDKTLVRLHGEVDKDFSHVDFDVDRIEIVK